MTTVDLSPIVQALVSAAALTITGAVPVVLTWLFQQFKVSKDTLAAQTISTAVTGLSQAAISRMTTASAGAGKVQVKSEAIASVMQNLSDGTIAAMKARNVTPETIAQRVDGEIIKALPLAPQT